MIILIDGELQTFQSYGQASKEYMKEDLKEGANNQMSSLKCFCNETSEGELVLVIPILNQNIK